MREAMATTCVQAMPSNSSPPTTSRQQQNKPPERPLSVVRRGSTPLYKGRVSPTADGGEASLPEKDLLNRYRHVYAGRGGWYGYKNGPHGPINQNNKAASLRHVDKYQREILQKLSKNLQTGEARGTVTVGSKQRQSPKPTVVGAFKENRTSPLVLDQTDRANLVKDVPNINRDTGIRDCDVAADSTDNGPDGRPESTGSRDQDEETPGTERDLTAKTNSINNEVNIAEVTSTEVCGRHYSSVSSATARSTAVTSTNITGSYDSPEIDKYSVQTSAELVQQKISPSLTGPRPIVNHATGDSHTGTDKELLQRTAPIREECSSNLERSSLVGTDPSASESSQAVRERTLTNQLQNCGTDVETGGVSTLRDALETSRTEVGLTTARSCPSRLDEKNQELVTPKAGHSGGHQRYPLTSRTWKESSCNRPKPRRLQSRSRYKNPGGPSRRKLDVFSRMSQEARWAISETRREMGLDDDDNNDKDNDEVSVTGQGNNSCEEDYQRPPKDNDSNCTEIDNASCYQNDLGEEQDQVDQVNQSGKVNQGDMELLEPRRHGFPRHQYSKRNSEIRDDVARSRAAKTRGGVAVNQTRETVFTATDLSHGSVYHHQQQHHQQQQQQQQQPTSRKQRYHSRKSQQPGSQLYRRPMTKLPEISCGESRDSVGDFLPNSPRLAPDRRIPGIGNYKVIPVTKLKREGTFEITPAGYDSRFRDMRRRDLEVADDTPEEVKARAIEKCKEWFNKYWL